MATIQYNVKNEMLNALAEGLTFIELKYQDGTTSTTQDITQLWNAPSTGSIQQNENAVFSIDTALGDINVSGFNLKFASAGTIGISFNFETIYNYNNNGTFTIDGASIVVS